MILKLAVGGAVAVGLLLAVGIGLLLLRRRRARRPEWEVQGSDSDRESAYLTVVKVGDADASRVRVYGYRCDVDVVTEGPAGEHRLPMGYSLPVVKPGWKLHISIDTASAPVGVQPQVVVEWWDWTEGDNWSRRRRPHQTNFAIHPQGTGSVADAGERR